MNLSDLSFTDNWTLFLDRDGVINQRIPDGYITGWDKFEFIEGSLEAIALLGKVFARIIIVSNQQGIGKGLMDWNEMAIIDNKMKEAINAAGGRIDASYYSPYLETEHHPDRKPGSGLGLKAKKDFPSIEFYRSVMVGDSRSDIEFGIRLGMVTVFIGKDNGIDPDEIKPDLCFTSLKELGDAIMKILSDKK